MCNPIRYDVYKKKTKKKKTNQLFSASMPDRFAVQYLFTKLTQPKATFWNDSSGEEYDKLFNLQYMY